MWIKGKEKDILINSDRLDQIYLMDREDRGVWVVAEGEGLEFVLHRASLVSEAEEILHDYWLQLNGGL